MSENPEAPDLKVLLKAEENSLTVYVCFGVDVEILMGQWRIDREGGGYICSRDLIRKVERV